MTTLELNVAAKKAESSEPMSDYRRFKTMTHAEFEMLLMDIKIEEAKMTETMKKFQYIANYNFGA